jgi:DNA-binding response OmpR family regulator
MTRVLVVEDDPAIQRGLADNLAEESYDVRTASDGEAGYRLIRDWQPHLVILDLMLPRMSGYDVCRRIRAEKIAVPILMLTARGDEADRVLGLDLGADDYMSKPFSVRELLARVRALLRRAEHVATEPDSLTFGNVEVDFRQYTAAKGGRPVDLTRKEFGVLRFLAARAGVVARRDQLLENVWDAAADTTTRTVDNHIASLRAKLEDDPPNPLHLLTVHGVGYKWVP